MKIKVIIDHILRLPEKPNKLKLIIYLLLYNLSSDTNA